MNAPHEMIRTAARARLLLHAEGQEAIIQFLESQRHPDGGFRGRTPASDLYYTVFGLCCLIALDRPLPVASTVRFLATATSSDLDFVHLASAVRCLMLLSTPDASACALPFLQRLEVFRSGDGGYHHQLARAAAGTVYGAFLAFLAYQESGLPIPRQELLPSTLEAQRTPDGGYANAVGVSQSTATATAAAILLKKWIAGGFEKSSPDKVNDAAAIAALQRCTAPSGGFFAFAGAPVPDLLSTATSLLALRSAGIRHASTSLHESFIESLWQDGGGFCGHAADHRQPDVEYTFYALLALGCCTG